jgi:hypothetical protein
MSNSLINAENAIRFKAAAQPLTSLNKVNLRGRSKRLRADQKPSPVTILKERADGSADIATVTFTQSGKPTAEGARQLARLSAE